MFVNRPGGLAAPAVARLAKDGRRISCLELSYTNFERLWFVRTMKGRGDGDISGAARRVDAAAAAGVSAGAERDGVRARCLCAGADFDHFRLSDAAAVGGVRPGVAAGAGEGRADDRTGGVRTRGQRVGGAGLAWRQDRRASAALFGRVVAVVADAGRDAGGRGRRPADAERWLGPSDAGRDRCDADRKHQGVQAAAGRECGAESLACARPCRHHAAGRRGEWRCR